MSLGKMNWANLLNYQVQPSDMDLFQTYMNGPFSARLAAERTSGVIYGGVISVVSGFQLQITAGAAVMPDGTFVTWPVLTFNLTAANATLSRIDRIELAYALTNNTTVTTVTNVSAILDQLYVVSVNVNTGTAASSPSINSTTSGNISLGAISVSAASTVINPSNIAQVVDTNLTISALMLNMQDGAIRYNPTLGIVQFANNGTSWQSMGSGGGAGGASEWYSVGGSGAVSSYEFDDEVFLFGQGLSQSLTIWVKMPTSFLAGSQVTMNLGHYSPSSSNNFQFQAVTSLVRKGVDAVNSVANQHTSANSYVTNTSAYEYVQTSYDLTDSSGEVNGVGVSPGDLLKVVLTRITPTAGTDDSSDVRMIPSTTEVIL